MTPEEQRLRAPRRDFSSSRGSVAARDKPCVAIGGGSHYGANGTLAEEGRDARSAARSARVCALAMFRSPPTRNRSRWSRSTRRRSIGVRRKLYHHGQRHDRQSSAPDAGTGTACCVTPCYGPGRDAGRGTTGYEYRLSMTQTSLRPIASQVWRSLRPSKQAVQGQCARGRICHHHRRLGTIGIRSAERPATRSCSNSRLRCARTAARYKRTRFLRIAAAAAPMHVNAAVSVIGFPPSMRRARVPTHPVAADPPGVVRRAAVRVARDKAPFACPRVRYAHSDRQ